MDYVSVFSDDFSSPEWKVKNGDCDLFCKGILQRCGGYRDFTLQNVLYLDRLYGADKRICRIEAEFYADSVMNIHFFRTDTTGQLPNESEFVVDFKNQRLAMCALCDERFIYDESYVCESDFSLKPGTYTVEIEKDDCINILRIKGERTYSLKLFGVSAGCQQGFYGLSLREGTPFRLKNIDISIMNRPKICFVGDSITEGCRLNEMSGKEARKYCYSRILRERIGNCLISAAGSDTIDHVLKKFETEYKYIHPEYISVIIGTNGSNEDNSAENYKKIADKCNEYGIKLILNHIPPTDYCDYRTRNKNIDSVGAIGFDTETVLLKDGKLDEDKFDSDMIHPNANGNRAIADYFYEKIVEVIENDI